VLGSWTQGPRTGEAEVNHVSEEGNDDVDERRSLIRQVRQRLESLGRAGLVQIPRRAARRPSEWEGTPAGPVGTVRAESPAEDGPFAAPACAEDLPGPSPAPPASTSLAPAPPQPPVAPPSRAAVAAAASAPPPAL